MQAYGHKPLHPLFDSNTSPVFDPQRYGSRIQRIDQRLMVLAKGTYSDADAARLARRLLKYCNELFTFLDRPEVPFENNLAERMVRPAVLLRKISQGNRSERGAAIQAVLMSVYRTLKLRGHDPVGTIVSALRTYLSYGRIAAVTSTIRCRRVKCYPICI